MTDRDQDDEVEQRPHTAPEGVRILGAEEAQAALEGGGVARRLDDDAPRYGDVPPRPDPGMRPAARFPTPSGPTWSGAEEDLFTPERAEPSGAGHPGPSQASAEDESEAGDSSGPVPLPHWTEPPTGEVPIILPEAEPVDITGEDELDAWVSSTGSAPRFRSGAGDWAEADFADEGLKDETTALGALADQPDEDAEFAANVAAKRRRRLRPRAEVAPGAETEPSVKGDGRGRRRPHAETGEPADAAHAARPGADVATRVVTGIAIAVGALICLQLGRGPTAFLAAAVVGFSAFELCDALRKARFNPATIIVLLGSVALVLAAYEHGEAAFPLLMALVTVFTFLWYLIEVVKARATVNIAATLLGFAYVGVLGGFAGLLLEFRDGVGLILGLAICAVGYDVLGYAIGSQFGKTRLVPKVSPNKTLEGLLGGMTASIVLAVLVVSHIHPWTDVSHALALGVVVAVMAPLGDLCESLLKRDLGIKDFGSILPGHGGFLDRFDAVVFCLPAVYYLFLWLR